MSINDTLLFHFVVSYFATAAFGIVFYAPPRTLPFSALTGACGYSAYYFISKNYADTDILACVVGGIVIAFMSEMFSHIQKTPVTAYEMPAIMPLVPGIGLYRTMISFLEKNSVEGLNHLFETIMAAGSIAIGLILTEAAAQIYFREKYRKKRNRHHDE